MKAMIQKRFGGLEMLRFGDVAKPLPAGNEVLVRVHAASLNARDWHMLRGDPYLARITEWGLTRPKQAILGTDFAGTVEAVGPAVTRLRPGDEVYGEEYGAFAEYVCASEDVVDVKPANLTFEQAAAIPLAGNTALMGIRDVGRVQPGERILINGASGGVGTFAVQIAKAFGAEVTAVCSTRNVDLVRSLGADRVVDYTREDFIHGDSFTRGARRYDVVLDLVGNRSLTDLRRAMAPEGTLILSGGGVFRGRPTVVGPMALIIKATAVDRFVRHRLRLLPAKPSAANLAALRELVESGKVTPVIDRTYKLSEVPEAIRYIEVEHARAKVVITVDTVL